MSLQGLKVMMKVAFAAQFWCQITWVLGPVSMTSRDPAHSRTWAKLFSHTRPFIIQATPHQMLEASRPSVGRNKAICKRHPSCNKAQVMEGISPWSKMRWCLRKTAKREGGCMSGMPGLCRMVNSQGCPSTYSIASRWLGWAGGSNRSGNLTNPKFVPQMCY